MNTWNSIRLARAFLLFIGIVAALVLVGWATNSTLLTSVVPGMAAMNPVTAIGFLLCSLWFYLYQLKSLPRLATVVKFAAAALVFLIGSLKLLEYAGAVHIYFDRWVFTGKLKTKDRFDVIAPNTALLFALSGLLFFNAFTRSPIGRQMNDIIKLVGFLIAYLGIMGYIYSIRPTYQIGPFVPMALNTACCFMALFTAAVFILPKGKIIGAFASDRMGGRMARKAIPVLIILPVFFGYLRLLGEHAGLYESEYGTALYASACVFMLLWVLYRNAARLNKEEKKKDVANLQIAKSENKYRTLVDTMKEGVVYFNREQEILFCNKSFSDITGFSSESLRSKKLRTLFSATNTVEEQLFKKLDNFQSVDNYEIELVHSDGYKVWVSVSGKPVQISGDVKAAFLTISDITEKKKVISDLESFISFAAHDLRVPIARVKMLTEMLGEEVVNDLSEEGKQCLLMLNKTVVEAGIMLDDVLRLAKLNADNLDKKELNTQELVQDVIERLRHINPKATIRLHPLPKVFADGPALRQVWMNLVSNALKYSSKKEHPEVIIGSETKNDKTIFFVKDNGAGFSMDKAAKLFTPFAQFHSGYEGNGLGLPIVKRIIEKHRGRLWADAVEGQGATFYFTIEDAA
jgi:PAS domain S-box-containing protein